MTADTALALVSAIAAILGSLVVWLTLRETRRESRRKVAEARDTAKIKAIVLAELKPFIDQQQELHARVDNIVQHQDELQRDLRDMTRRTGELLDRVAVIGTKVDVYWKTVENLAMDAAKIIHSPDPRRAHIDALLDSFMDGTISSKDADELRGILVFLRDWEPGKPSAFPVYQGEQIAAAILLRTMDQALSRKRG